MKTRNSIVFALTACLLGALSLPTVGSDDVDIRAVEHYMDFLADKELVGRYNIAGDIAKPYFWPVNGPGGVKMTRAWPMEPALPGGSKDHVHQKSIWFCHGDVIPEGIEPKDKIRGVVGVDFWSESQGHGRIVNSSTKPVRSQQKNQSGLSLATHLEWQMSDGAKILDEDRTIYLYAFENKTRLFVFDIDLHASVYPITFGDTKEGSFGVRVNDAIRERGGDGKLENADGKIGMRQCWGQKSAWCDYSGAINGKNVGIAILDDPKNPYLACWHARDYGLMAANPFGRAKSGFPAMRGKTGLVKLAKGEHLQLRYGILIHPGDAKEGKVAEYFEKFVKLR